MVTYNADTLYNGTQTIYTYSTTTKVTINGINDAAHGWIYGAYPATDSNFTISSSNTQKDVVIRKTTERGQELGRVTITFKYEAPAVATINVSASPPAGGTVSQSGSGQYTLGQTAWIYATANSGYRFDHWSAYGNTYPGNDVDKVITQDMLGNTYNCVATFVQATPRTISVSASPSAGGTVSGGGTYYDGDVITISASANPGYRFGHWERDGVFYSNSSSFTYEVYNNNRNFVAYFTRITHTITASAGAGGSISPSGNVTVNHGSSKTFTITANNGYQISSIFVDGSPINF